MKAFSVLIQSFVASSFSVDLNCFVLWGFCFRYITVLYYLNDPEEGGETAFPIADKPDDYIEVSSILGHYFTSAHKIQ